jgi:hypothetical protein
VHPSKAARQGQMQQLSPRTALSVAEQEQSGLRKLRSDLGSKRGPYKKKEEQRIN